MYDGQAKILAFRDSKGLQELEYDYDTNTFNLFMGKTNKPIDTPITIFLKNVGEKRAYRVIAQLVSGDISNLTLVDKIEAGATKRVTFNLKNSILSKKNTAKVRVDYDSL